MATKQFHQAAQSLFSSIIAAASMSEDIKAAAVLGTALNDNAFNETVALVKAYIVDNGAPTDKGVVYALSEDALSELQAIRAADLKRAGQKTKDADGKKDAVCNRLAVYKTRILKNLETLGQLENASPEQKKAEKASKEAKKSADEALKSAQDSSKLQPVTVQQLLQALSMAVLAGALDRADWAAAHHLAMRIEAGYAAFHGNEQPVPMAEVVESAPALH